MKLGVITILFIRIILSIKLFKGHKKNIHTNFYSNRNTFYFNNQCNLQSSLENIERSKKLVKKIIFSNLSSSFILKVLKKCSECSIKTLNLEIYSATSDLDNFIDFVPSFKITSLQIWNSDLNWNIKKLLLNLLSKKVKSLEISKTNDIGGDLIVSIIKNKNITLRRVHLTHNTISNITISEIFRALINNKTLKTIYISRFVSDNDNMAIECHIINLLKVSCIFPNIQYFELDSNGKIKFYYTLRSSNNGTRLLLDFYPAKLWFFTEILKAILSNENTKITKISFKNKNNQLLSSTKEERVEFNSVCKKFSDRNILISTNNNKKRNIIKYF